MTSESLPVANGTPSRFSGVDDVAVVAERQLPVRAADPERLGVIEVAGAGGRVARVADGELARQVAQVIFIEDLRD